MLVYGVHTHLLAPLFQISLRRKKSLSSSHHPSVAIFMSEIEMEIISTPTSSGLTTVLLLSCETRSYPNQFWSLQTHYASEIPLKKLLVSMCGWANRQNQQQKNDPTALKTAGCFRETGSSPFSSQNAISCRATSAAKRKHWWKGSALCLADWAFVGNFCQRVFSLQNGATCQKSPKNRFFSKKKTGDSAPVLLLAFVWASHPVAVGSLGFVECDSIFLGDQKKLWSGKWLPSMCDSSCLCQMRVWLYQASHASHRFFLHACGYSLGPS